MTKNDKHQKSSINCAFSDRCARRNCLFMHPDGRNLIANQAKIEQERRENLADLQLQRAVRLTTQCRHGDICHQVDCPLQHSPDWNPQKNQQLAEDKRRRDEQRKEEQRKHAYDVSMKETIEKTNKLDTCRSESKPLDKNIIGEEYQYDDEYFDIQEKIWKKQSASSRNCW